MEWQQLPSHRRRHSWASFGRSSNRPHQILETGRYSIQHVSTLFILVILVGALVYPRQQEHRAIIRPIEVLQESEDACAEAIGSGKIALMFLITGDLFHTPTWAHWFQSAAGVMPMGMAANTGCHLHGVALEAAAEACTTLSDDVIGSQHLFNVYVHLTADVHESLLDEFWRPYVIQERVHTEWGTHSLIEATRYLLWQAFRDPVNQRFVLISESDLPIWDPLTFYEEIMSEKRSKVDAWWHPEMHKGRWSMKMEWSAGIQLRDWRKSAQWFSIIRRHAQLILEDEEIFKAFELYCKNSWDSVMKRWRECISDEHYIATLLYKKGLQDETIPSPLGVTAADWSRKGPHPREYEVSEVTAELFFDKLRYTEVCPLNREDQKLIQESARGTFVPLEQVFGEQRSHLCDRIAQGYQNVHEDGVSISDPRSALNSSTSLSREKLPATCYLLARKFGPSTVAVVEALFLNCSSGLDLVGDTVCSQNSGL